MKNKIAMKRKFVIAALLMFALAIGSAAQKIDFSIGDTVQMPNGKTGKIESLEGEVAKVKIGNETDFIAVQDLKKIETTPARTFRVGDQVVNGSQMRIAFARRKGRESPLWESQI